EAEAASNGANADATRRVNDARQAAADQARGAEAARAAAIADAKGEADAFSAVDAQYRGNPDLTRQRLYMETMERILAQAPNVVVDAKNGSAPVMLPPDLFKKSPPPAAA